jgi:hypothetical protein
VRLKIEIAADSFMVANVDNVKMAIDLKANSTTTVVVVTVRYVAYR